MYQFVCALQSQQNTTHALLIVAIQINFYLFGSDALLLHKWLTLFLWIPAFFDSDGAGRRRPPASAGAERVVTRGRCQGLG